MMDNEKNLLAVRGNWSHLNMPTLPGPPCKVKPLPRQDPPNLEGSIGSANESRTDTDPFEDRRPKVRLPGDNYLLSDCARQIGKILAPFDIFSRGGLAFIINQPRTGLTVMTPEMLRTWIEEYLVCYKPRKAGLEGSQLIEIRRTITQTDATGILASLQFISQLQPIEGFNPVRMPAFDRWGYVKLLEEGYDDFTKTFTVDSVPIIERMPLKMAKDIINELLSEFYFADGSRSKAVAVAAMLTVFGRHLLPERALRPCFIFLANAEGAGKTLLVKCATVPVLGHAPVGTMPRDEEEMRKALLTAALEAKPVIFFDNVKGHISSAALEAFLSSQHCDGRVLGQSKSFTGTNDSIVFITGNGCTVSPDMRRRSLFCELFLEVERAEERVFQNTLEVNELLKRRSEILSALLALVMDWHNAMEPSPSRSNSSFPDWSRIISGIVENAGFGCPLEQPQIESAADREGADMRELVAAVANGSAQSEITFDELVRVARERGLFEWWVPVEGDMDRASRSAMGKMLKRFDGRLVGDHRVLLQGKGKTRRYILQKPGNGRHGGNGLSTLL